MSLQKRCLNEVLPRDRERGVAYFHQRRVSLGARENGGIAATVEGSDGNVYEVRLDWSEADPDGRLYASCSCPRFADAIACKHLWATIVAFDRAGFTEPVPGRGPLDLALEGPGASKAAPASRIVRGGGLYFDPDDPHPFRLADGSPAPIRLYQPPAEQKVPEWRLKLQALVPELSEARTVDPASQRRRHRLAYYRLNVARCFEHEQLVVDVYQRKAKQNGELGKMTGLNLVAQSPRLFPEAADRDLLALLQAGPDVDAGPYAGYRMSYTRTHGVVPALLYETILPQLCATGRFAWVADANSDPVDAAPLAWDAGPAWRLVIELSPQDGGRTVSLTGSLRRGAERRPLGEAVLLLGGGVVVWRDEIARLDAGAEFPWISLFRREREIRVPDVDLDLLLEDLSGLPALPRLDMPPAWRWGEVRPEPKPRLTLRPSAGYRSKALLGDVVFDYDRCLVPARRRASQVFDRERRRLVHRDAEAEQATFERLKDLDIRPPAGYATGQCDVQLSEKVFTEAIGALLAEGWVVEAEGRRMRAPGSVSLSVSSGLDWFELSGDVEFDGARVELPRLLRAVRRGERMIRLDDGSQGMLPEEWLERYGPLARMAHEKGGAVRYLPSQAALLDVLLAAEPAVEVDRKFERVRDRLLSVSRVAPAAEPRGFVGRLRSYQQDGLGWLKFLQEVGLGGCLADDMGLGKTVQVLALLQTRRLGRRGAGRRLPSLIVAPKSLVHNWIEEAARFTPRLGVVSYTGPRRADLLAQLGDADMVVTTYGLLRRDAARLKDVRFDYAVLDEAQAIKNASSQAAKASRLLGADHRLALTGTPVENHLGELWSIFEFLNPGMLGKVRAFKALTGGRAADGAATAALARALKPFILRRTKEQVLDDLPEKTEQTLWCELDRTQLKLYEELRDHYRAALDRRIEERGLERAKIHVLEALLRLRQAACHPGLIDPARIGQSSAKLETLLEQVEEVADGGHKALVFSQFVSLLEIVKRHLEKRGVVYEYLDGQTRDRKRRIDRFQTDPGCRLFLISLKAGGLGLNLTAADYVFILDPWWNPAVEAQAVDRAHRIGQTRPVFAYRLIASGTVEEKILELQSQKRELADAILSESRSVIRDLSAEDLKLLLS